MGEDDFLFIEETGTRHKAATKSRIKMHVMDRVVKQKRTPKPDPTRIRRLESKDFQENQPHMHYSSQPGFLSGVEDMVQLAGLPIDLVLNTRSPLMCTIASETGWLKYALEDGALFNSTLCYWGLLNHERLPVKYLNQESMIRLKGLAISKISLRLNATNHDGVDDAVIASVACLANVNLKIGNIEEAKIHFRGLTAMIRGRRGIHTSLGYEGLIVRLLKATDNFHSQLSGTKLSFEEPAELSTEIESKPPLNFTFDGMVTHLRTIAAQLIASPKEKMSLEERVQMGQQLLASDQEILKHIHQTAPCISTVISMGALVYSHTFLRGMERSFPLVKASVTQLKASMTAAYALNWDLFDENPLALVWVLFVGALASEDTIPDEIWFRECLEKACETESQRVMESLQTLIDTRNRGTPLSFDWLFQDIGSWIQCSSVNTKIL